MLTKGKVPVKPCDVGVIILAMALTGFAAFRIYAAPQDSFQVLIEASGRTWVYPLDAEETIPVPGPLGDTVIRIGNNQTWVESSPCDNQICVSAGMLSSIWHFAACLPNNVLLVIQGHDTLGNIDAAVW